MPLHQIIGNPDCLFSDRLSLPIAYQLYSAHRRQLVIKIEALGLFLILNNSQTSRFQLILLSPQLYQFKVIGYIDFGHFVRSHWKPCEFEVGPHVYVLKLVVAQIQESKVYVRTHIYLLQMILEQSQVSKAYVVPYVYLFEHILWQIKLSEMEVLLQVYLLKFVVEHFEPSEMLVVS